MEKKETYLNILIVRISMKNISILIPAYNEEKYIKKTTLETLNYLKNLELNSFEIIIIPNGCTDNTENLVRALSKKYKEINYIISEKGAGNAIKKGIEKASNDIITWVFADGEMDYSFIGRGLDLMEEYDLINGSRFKKSGKFGVDRGSDKKTFSNFLRRFLSYSCRVYTLSMIRLPISEIGILKMFRKDWAQKNLKIESSGWGLQSDILMQASIDDLRIKDIPISIQLKRPTAESRLNVFQEMKSLLKSITKAGIKIRIAKLKRLFR